MAKTGETAAHLGETAAHLGGAGRCGATSRLRRAASLTWFAVATHHRLGSRCEKWGLKIACWEASTEMKNDGARSTSSPNNAQPSSNEPRDEGSDTWSVQRPIHRGAARTAASCPRQALSSLDHLSRVSADGTREEQEKSRELKRERVSP